MDVSIEKIKNDRLAIQQEVDAIFKKYTDSYPKNTVVFYLWKRGKIRVAFDKVWLDNLFVSSQECVEPNKRVTMRAWLK